MEPLQNAASSPESMLGSSPDILSPGGKSRYGRTRRPKISRDFCNIDDVVIDENPPSKLKPPLKAPIIRQELVFDGHKQFTKLDDLGMRVANNFRTNLQRGLDDTIKERKFFKTMPENKVDVSNVVDVTKVLKLISKPVVSEICEVRPTPKTALKTYSNKRKHVHDSDCFIVESFGLPDEPIIPVNSPLVVERNTKIDVDMSGKVDVNLANPWVIEDFDPVPLYASEPVSVKDDFNFRGGMLHLMSSDNLLGENTELLAAATTQDHTNFEKSRIPTPEKKVKEVKDKIVGVKNVEKNTIDDLFTEVSDFFSTDVMLPPTVKIKNNFGKIIKKKFNTDTDDDDDDIPLQRLLSPKDHNNTKKVITKMNETDSNITEKFKSDIVSLGVEKQGKWSNKIKSKTETRTRSLSSLEAKEVKKATRYVKLSSLKKSKESFPKRILRSSLDNNNTQFKEDCIIISDGEQSQKLIPPKPRKLLNTICSPEIRVVLNPLSYTHRHLDENLVLNPFKFKTEALQPTKKTEALQPTKKTEALQPTKKTEALQPTKKMEALQPTKKTGRQKKTSFLQQSPVQIKDEDIDVKNVKEEPIEFQVGDLAWAKLGSHPYWPCMITKEPISGQYRKSVVNRTLPLYHVRFFGDKGRRAWVKANSVMLFFNRDDLENLAKKLKSEDKSKSTFIQESYVIKPNKLSKWQEGVSEAESLKDKSVQKRLRYFFDMFASDREKKNLKKSEESEYVPDKKVGESSVEGKKRTRRSNSNGLNKKSKNDVKSEILVEDENEIKKEVAEESLTDSKTPKGLTTSPKKKFLEKITNSPSVRSSKTTSPLVKKHPEPSTPHSSRNSLKPEEFTEVSIEARKKLRNFRATPTASEQGQELQTETAQIPNSSDTDSKFSDNSSVPTSLESQAALFRRNNIFRGIPKEKVCQVCEEGGEVFKCKGPCNGVYHQQCAMKRKKDEEGEVVVEEKKEEEEKNNVEIISVASSKPLPDLSKSPNYKGMTLAEKIDFRMKEIMKKFDHQTVYSESTDSSSEEFVLDESLEKSNQSKLSLTVTNKPTKKEVPIIKHVTADNIAYICVTNDKSKETKDPEEIILENSKNSKCSWCATRRSAPCLICHTEESKTGSKFLQKCSLHQCGKYYHSDCVKSWPQTQWSFIQSTKDKQSDKQHDTFVCPRHVCHTCISDDPRAANSRCSSDKVVKCLRCPATYHSSNYCVPAGTHILSGSQIICPRHFTRQTTKKKLQQTINTNWCFICSKGGNLICCETCPTSVHVECLPGDLNEDDTFFCEDCQSGRLPLYDEIVWVKLGSFRWWPALILFPNEVPDNVKNMVHNKGEFVVKFYGTYDHYWVARGRTFLFQEGDKGHSKASKKRVDNAFNKAIEEAAAAHQLKKQFKLSKVAQQNSGLKPPPYIRIKVNKPVGNVRLFDGNTSNTTSCDCDPNQPHPCGPDSDCLNRLLLTECNPEVCPAGDRCNNQCFEKREYPPLIPHRTQVRGWGLKTLAPIRKGQFVIEYVGELIDEQEYQRRIQKMHEQKEENYYFLTIDKDRTLDAGPKGNVARFMNHSCQPNCETQKWTVNCDTRVGLFANCDLPADTELTFNYNLECIGKEKKICRCGAPNCSGFIGVKVKQEGATKKSTKPKKKKPPPPEVVYNENPCFICKKVGDVGACNNKICTKYYHLRCVGLTSWPEGGKWMCPWHSCNICSKRTIRCCIQCVNSYCPPHSEGSVRHDKLLGFVCFEHDPAKTLPVVPSTPIVAGCDVETSENTVDSFDSTPLTTRLNGFVTSTPLKKSKRGNSSQEESVRNTSNTKSGQKKTYKQKKRKRKSPFKVVGKRRLRNVSNLMNLKEKEKKLLSKSMPMRNLRSRGTNAQKELIRTDPEEDLPIRKRTRLGCRNTL